MMIESLMISLNDMLDNFFSKLLFLISACEPQFMPTFPDNRSP